MADKNRKLKPARRFRYTEYYTVSRSIGEDGRPVETAEYTGAYLSPLHEARTYACARRLIRVMTALSVLALVLLLAVRGFSVYSGCAYVLIPATAALFSSYYTVRGALKLPEEDRRLQKDTFEFGHRRVKSSAVADLVLSGLCALLSAVNMLAGRVLPNGRDVLYWLLLAVIIASGIIIIKSVSKLEYTEA